MTSHGAALLAQGEKAVPGIHSLYCWRDFVVLPCKTSVARNRSISPKNRVLTPKCSCL